MQDLIDCAHALIDAEKELTEEYYVVTWHVNDHAEGEIYTKLSEA